MRRTTTHVRQPLRLAGVLILLVLAAVLGGCIGQGSPERFTYVIHLQSRDTGQRVAEADITLQVGSDYRVTATSNNDGFASMLIDARYRDQSATLDIEAFGFSPTTETVQLRQQPIPEVIELDPAGS